MFGIGGFEFLIIIIIVFLIFGPERMAAGAKTVGKAIGKFRDAQQEMSKTINADIQNPDPEEPWKKSVEALDKFGKTVTKTVSESTFAGQKTKAAEEKAAREEEQALRKAAEAAKAEADAAEARAKAARAEADAAESKARAARAEAAAEQLAEPAEAEPEQATAQDQEGE